MTRLALPALRADDSLGVLAALGLLALCEDGLGVAARLGWEGPDGSAVVEAPFDSSEELAAAVAELAATLRAEERLTPGVDPALISAPLGNKERKQLDDAGALDPMKMSADSAVRRFQSMQDRELDSRGPDAGWLVALIGQTTAAKRDAAERRLTPLYSPSGQMTLRQIYRDALETVDKRPDVIREALVAWRREKGTGANLDSRALVDAADASGGVAANQHVPGATWLALQSAPWFTQVGDGAAGEAVAWRYPRGGARFRWPVWRPLLSPSAVRLLLAHPAVRWADQPPSRGLSSAKVKARTEQYRSMQNRRARERRVLGVCALYEARRKALSKSAGPLQAPVLLWQS